MKRRRMNWRGIRAIVGKDLRAVRKNKGVSIPMIVIPILILVVIPSMETRNEFIKLKTCFELLCPSKQIEIIVGKGCDNGLDFEDVRELVEALDKIYQGLKEECGYKAQDILIDITGGQKVSTIAGAIVSLSEGRSFQYVSTKNYSISTYDVTYQVA